VGGELAACLPPRRRLRSRRPRPEIRRGDPSPHTRTRAFESPASPENYILCHRFVGKAEAGVDVSVLVSFPLSAAIGRRVDAPKMTGALPPRRIVRAPELKLLAETWVGGYRNGVDIDVPIRAAV